MSLVAKSKVLFMLNELEISIRVEHLPGVSREDIILRAADILRRVYDIDMERIGNTMEIRVL